MRVASYDLIIFYIFIFTFIYLYYLYVIAKKHNWSLLILINATKRISVRYFESVSLRVMNSLSYYEEIP